MSFVEAVLSAVAAAPPPPSLEDDEHAGHTVAAHARMLPTTATRPARMIARMTPHSAPAPSRSVRAAAISSSRDAKIDRPSGQEVVAGRRAATSGGAPVGGWAVRARSGRVATSSTSPNLPGRPVSGHEAQSRMLLQPALSRPLPTTPTRCVPSRSAPSRRATPTVEARRSDMAQGLVGRHGGSEA